MAATSKEAFPIVGELPKTYFSTSFGREILINQLQSQHLSNAISRLERQKQEGRLDTTQASTLIALTMERERRRLNETKTAPPPPTATPAAPVVTFAELAQKLTTLANGIAEGNTTDPLLQKLASVINGGAIVEPATTPVRKTATPLYDGATRLNRVFSQRLSNSMASYGLNTMGDLRTISPEDFAAIRYSAVADYQSALAALEIAGSSFACTSAILIHDGRVNSQLNPNVSDIKVFVDEAGSRLGTCRRPSELERLFQGIKRRVSTAINLEGMRILAQGYRGTAADTEVDGLQLRSPAFKAQLKRYLKVMVTRLSKFAVDPITGV